MDKNVRVYLSQIGRRGGQKSRRILDSKTAQKMVLLREARRAYKKFYARCFWSYSPTLKITFDDLPWVGRQLIKHGDLKLWELGKKLCP
jgi:hypothetical protein